jgi:thiosulfate dehydrogenase [quinone] large subunit
VARSSPKTGVSPRSEEIPRRDSWRSAFDAATALLVLRAFLGVTFVFAGLQKLSNPDFFRASAPGSIQNQLQAALHSSPVPALVRPALHAPVLFGAVIALAELAVGLGTLLGLWARLAALGGLALSLTFFLTVSFNTWPYYYGADIVFVFAWTPFVLAGATILSLDSAIAHSAYREWALNTSEPLPSDVSRRILLRKGALAGVLAVVGIVMAGITAGLGRILALGTSTTATAALAPGTTTTSLAGATGVTPTTAPPGPSTTSPAGAAAATTTTVPPVAKGTPIGPASDVPVGGAAQFTDPTTQQPAFALQLTAGHFSALSAVCTHAGCLVQFSQSDDTFVCPCHGSVFDAHSGRVLNGPAFSPLPSIAITEGPEGTLYVED